jgi:hypothetical protein
VGQIIDMFVTYGFVVVTRPPAGEVTVTFCTGHRPSLERLHQLQPKDQVRYILYYLWLEADSDLRQQRLPPGTGSG